MTKSPRCLMGATINADDLFERYEVAWALKRQPDLVKVESHVRHWAAGIGISETAIRFVTNASEVEAASRAAKAAWDARVPSAVWDALAPWDSWPARDAWATSAARDAFAACAATGARHALDLSYVAAAVIGASSEGEEETIQKWLGLFEAFEAGAFIMWVGADTIYVAVIPQKIAFDDRRRLHCADGPAFMWLDDIRDYYWHGVYVPDHVIERPQQISVAAVDAETNVEVRRVMIERYRFGQDPHGAAAYMRDAGGKSLDHDERFGTLWRREVKGDDSIVVLEVINSTREPEGAFKHYWLRVPPTMKTAREAAAWTFDIPADKYAPSIET
jgi:hypothetical protein